MLIQGEKYACEACVRGHRVSNCQHFERPLQHINKKGRPVTQCQHCRSQRKNRSAHVKCDCGEKTTKCVHLGAKDGHRESCCCNHGGECSCAGYKNDLDPVPESASSGSEAGLSTPNSVSAPAPATATCAAVPKSPVRRSRANTSRSEGTLTFDEHGRHKPLTQKHAKAASRKTLPYPASRMSTSRSSSHLNGYLLGNSFHDDEDLDDILSNGNTGSDSGADDAGSAVLAASASVNGAGSAADSSFLPGQLSQQQRRSRSETDSPSFFASSFPLTSQMCSSSLTLSMGAVGSASGSGSYSTSNNTAASASFNPFSGDSLDQPLFSAGINPPSVDWANLGLDFDRGFDAGSEGLAESLSFSHNAAYDLENSAPTMTTGTSGEVSEADDNFGPPDIEHEFETDFESHADTASSSMAFSRVNSGLHLSNPILLAQAASLGGDSGELQAKAGSKFLPTPLAGAADDMSSLTMFQDDDQHLWLNEYNGLPTMTESPEPDAGISYWST